MNYTQKMGRRLATLILCLCMLLALFPTTALADNDVSEAWLNATYTGTYNSVNYSVTFDRSGYFTITNTTENTQVSTGQYTLISGNAQVTVYFKRSTDSGYNNTNHGMGGSFYFNGTLDTADATEMVLTSGESTYDFSATGATFLSTTEQYTVKLRGTSSAGTVTATNGTETWTIDATGVSVDENTSLTFTVTPNSEYYVSAWVIAPETPYTEGTETIDEIASAQGLQATNSAKQSEAVTTGTVSVERNLVITPVYSSCDGKVSSYLDWKENTEDTKKDVNGTSHDVLSYADALDWTYDAKVTAYLLDGNFGTSATQGQNLLADPTMYMTATFDADSTSSTTITVGAEDSQKTITGAVGAKTPTTNVALASGITADKVKPGKFTQTFGATYYTASDVCSNHWYHVYGVTYHTDEESRGFIILQDTLTLGVKDASDDSSATQTGTSAAYTYSDTLDITPTLITASSSAKNAASSQAKVPDVDNDTDKLITVTVTDSNGKVVTDLQNGYTPKKAGKYTYTVTYDGSGNDYVASYTADGTSKTEDTMNTYAALKIAVKIEKGTNPTKLMPAAVSKITSATIVLDKNSIVDGQLYSCDGGTTWYTKTQLANMNYTFSGLTQGTDYTIQTKLPETDQYNEKTYNTKAGDADTTVTTYVNVSGTVTQTSGEDGGAVPALPATVTITDSTGKTYTVDTDKDGKYSIDLPVGSYTVSATDANGWQAGTGTDFTLAKGNSDVTGKDIAMSNTDKGSAKVFADNNLTDGSGTLMDSLDDLATADAETLQKIVDSATAYEKLTDEAKGEVDKLLTSPATYKKLLAMAKLQQQIAAKKAELDQAVTDGTLSRDDADALADLIDAAAKKAEEGLNDAENTDTAIQAVVDQFDADMDLIDKKIAAAKQINEDVADAKAAIDALTNLTDAQKQAKKDEIDKAAQDAKDAVNAATTEDEINDALNGLAEDLKDIRDHAIAEDFVAGYFTDEDGNIFTDFDSSNIDQILGAQDAYDALTDDQKAIVDELLSQATGGKYSSYAEYAAGAQKAAEESAADFIKAHMTLNGKTIIAVTKDTYDSIVGGAEDWSKLSQAEKDAVNAQLKAAGATQTYEEMLAAVEKAADESSDDFIAKYLTNELGDIYTEATFGNYQQILSGLTDWNNMTQAERDAVNAKLMKAIGKTYEILLAEAQELERVMALLAVPDTGDDGSLTLLYVLMLVGAAGLTGTYVCGKRKKYGK